MCVIVYVYIYLWLYVYMNVYYIYYHNYLGIPILYPRSRIHVSAQPGLTLEVTIALKRSWRPATAPRPKGTAAGPERTSQNGYLAQNGYRTWREWLTKGIENDPKPMKYINISYLFLERNNDKHDKHPTSILVWEEGYTGISHLGVSNLATPLLRVNTPIKQIHLKVK